MGVEIERKWLVKELPEDISRYPNEKYIQGYLCTSPVVRVRKEGDRYVLTYKGEGLLKREEYNMPLTKDAFEKLIRKCDGKLIVKQRYFIQTGDHEGHVIELDIYKGDHEGLITAEVEFSSEEEAGSFMAPSWFGEDVSLREEYKNSWLSRS